MNPGLPATIEFLFNKLFYETCAFKYAKMRKLYKTSSIFTHSASEFILAKILNSICNLIPKMLLHSLFF